MARTSKKPPNPNQIFRDWMHTSNLSAYQLAKRSKEEKGAAVVESTFWRLENADYSEPTRVVREEIERLSAGAVPASIW